MDLKKAFKKSKTYQNLPDKRSISFGNPVDSGILVLSNCGDYFLRILNEKEISVNELHYNHEKVTEISVEIIKI